MSDIEVLDWEGLSTFFYEGLVKKKEINDGSCYFHSIADAFYRPYQLGEINRSEYIKNLRKDLSNKLTSEIYHKLGRGQLREFSTRVKGFSLDEMKKQLDSNEPIDNRFNEFISNIINKDIYIINYEKKNIYVTGKDEDILYKNRDSIVIIWCDGNHYDLAGVIEGRRLVTLFKYDHPFIQTIRKNMRGK